MISGTIGSVGFWTGSEQAVAQGERLRNFCPEHTVGRLGESRGAPSQKAVEFLRRPPGSRFEEFALLWMTTSIRLGYAGLLSWLESERGRVPGAARLCGDAIWLVGALDMMTMALIGGEGVMLRGRRCCGKDSLAQDEIGMARGARWEVRDSAAGPRWSRVRDSARRVRYYGPRVARPEREARVLRV